MNFTPREGIVCALVKRDSLMTHRRASISALRESSTSPCVSFTHTPQRKRGFDQDINHVPPDVYLSWKIVTCIPPNLMVIYLSLSCLFFLSFEMFRWSALWKWSCFDSLPRRDFTFTDHRHCLLDASRSIEPGRSLHDGQTASSNHFAKFKFYGTIIGIRTRIETSGDFDR